MSAIVVECDPQDMWMDIEVLRVCEWDASVPYRSRSQLLHIH